VFIKYYYLTADSTIRLPNWVLSGFAALLEKAGVDQDLDATIMTKLREILEQATIDSERIQERAKLELYGEWGI